MGDETLALEGLGGLRVAPPRSNRRVTARVKAFFLAYGGEAKCSSTEAAKLAGFRHPEVTGSQIKRRWPELVEAAEEKYLASLRLSDQELDQLAAEIAKDKNHKDQLRAIELIARMKGKLNDKVTVTIDRRGAMRQLEEAILFIQTLAVAKALPEPLSEAAGEDPNRT